MVETIFTAPLFKEIVFPFLLVFTLIFAILEKTKVLSAGKQNHALISLAISLIFIAVKPARDAVVGLAPFFAVVAVVFLVFMLLYGFVMQGDVNIFKAESWLKYLILFIVTASVIIAVLVSTGYWQRVVNMLTLSEGITVNLIILAVMGVAAYVIIKYSGAAKGS